MRKKLCCPHVCVHAYTYTDPPKSYTDPPKSYTDPPMCAYMHIHTRTLPVCAYMHAYTYTDPPNVCVHAYTCTDPPSVYMHIHVYCQCMCVYIHIHTYVCSHARVGPLIPSLREAEVHSGVTFYTLSNECGLQTFLPTPQELV